MSKILLVEDDLLIANAMRLTLESWSYACFHAPTGATGLALAERERPELVLLDLLLPDIDGFEVCRRLRANPATARARVLAVTSLATLAEIERAYACGADDYLIKPFENERLRLKIQKLLSPGT